MSYRKEYVTERAMNQLRSQVQWSSALSVWSEQCDAQGLQATRRGKILIETEEEIWKMDVDRR